MIDRLLNYWWYYTDTVRSRNYLHVEERYRELVLAYLHGDRTEDTYHIILNYQIKQHEEKLAEKRKRYTNPVDETMETIPELPKSFDTWVDRGPLLSARYIFYRYTKKRKAEGICSYCGAKVEIDHPHHNEQGTCPNCGSRIKYKAEGKSRTLTFTTRASLMQRTKDDRVVVRYFNIVRKFDENHTPQTGVWEMQRSFYNRDLDDLTEEPYEWGNFRNVSNRWVHLGDAKPKMFYTPNTTDDDYYAALYPYNVKALTKETVLRNFEVDKLAMHLQQGHFCLQSLIKRATKGEYFYEYMIKNQLYRLTGQVSETDFGYWSLDDETIDKKAKTINGLLRIDNDDIEILRQADTTISGLIIFRNLRKIGKRMTAEQLRHCIECGYAKGSAFENICKDVSIGKAIKYLDTQKCSDVLNIYHDYLHSCHQLHKDMKNSFILFPYHLKQAHDANMEEVAEEQKKIEKMKLAEKNQRMASMYEEIQDQYGYTGKTYCILAPKDVNMIKTEGEALHHCVYRMGYAERMLEGKCVILFLRRKTEQDKPFYTMEVNPNTMEIVQCHGFEDVDRDKNLVEGFIKNYQKFLKDKMLKPKTRVMVQITA